MVLMLSVDEGELLRHSLPPVLAQAPAPEVWVIDNASADDTAEVAERHGARVLRLPERLSYAAAINRGIAATAGTAVLLLNADCFLAEGALAAMVARLAGPGVGSVAPKLVRATLGAEGPVLFDELDAAAMGIDRRRKSGLVAHGRPAAGHATAAEAFGADGACALYRRETLADCRMVSGEVLDEDMALWASDADLAWRARLFGWRCMYEPAAVAAHIRTYSPSTRATVSEADRRLQFRNRLVMVAKNETGAGLRRDGLRIVGHEVLALGHAALRERHLLAGYGDAWRLRRAITARRHEVQGRRRVARPPFGLEPPA